jgi:hypothetical protein
MMMLTTLTKKAVSNDAPKIDPQSTLRSFRRMS